MHAEKRILYALTLCLWVAVAVVSRESVAAPVEEPRSASGLYEAVEGPFKIGIAGRIRLEDTQRQKAVAVKAYWPDGEGPYPVILFSHGAGDGLHAAPRLLAHWSSHGYVCLVPQHAADGKPPLGVLGLVRLVKEVRTLKRAGPDFWQDRTADLALVLDRLDEIESQVPDLAGKIDGARVGVSGHSLGSYGAVVFGGATLFRPGRSESVHFSDERAEAVLGLSGFGTDDWGLTSESWNSVRVPLMIMVGTRDKGPGGRPSSWRTEPFRYAAPGDAYLVQLQGAGHMAYVGIPRRRPPDKPLRKTDSLGAVAAASTAFWDAYLKDSAEARQFLVTGRLREGTAGRAWVEAK